MARKAASKVKGPSEDQIHRALMDHIRLRCSRSIVAWHTPNGSKRSKAEAGKLKAMGTLAGIPDVFLLAEGRLYGLELKTETGVVSLNQKVTMNLLKVNGATVAVAYGLDDALRILSGWGLINHPVSKQEPPHADGNRRGGHRARVPNARSERSRSQRSPLLVQA